MAISIVFANLQVIVEMTASRGILPAAGLYL